MHLHEKVVRGQRPSRHNGIDDLAMDVRQAVIAALKPVGKFLVLEAKAVEDGRLKIMHVYFVFRSMITEFIRRAMVDPAFDATSSQPDSKRMGMMIAAP